jgi:hypothetical protein
MNGAIPGPPIGLSGEVTIFALSVSLAIAERNSSVFKVFLGTISTDLIGPCNSEIRSLLTIFVLIHK